MAVAEASSQCSPVKPTTPLVGFLERLQETAFKTYGDSDFDPKLYVDLSLKFDLPETEEAFKNLPRSKNGSVSAEVLEVFLGKYMQGAGEDLVDLVPEDYVPEPAGFLPSVESPEVRAWALEVHSLWKNLSRKVSNRVQHRPDLHTLLPLPNPAMIPGSRFREVYYWDSYWVIRSVLFSFQS